MFLSTPWSRITAVWVKAPAAAEPSAARTVASTKAAGSAATPLPAMNPRPTSPAERVSPRRVRRGSHQVTRPRQAAANRADRPAQLARGLIVGHPFQVAEHDRRPVFLRQARDLLDGAPPQIAWSSLGPARWRPPPAIASPPSFRAPAAPGRGLCPTRRRDEPRRAASSPRNAAFRIDPALRARTRKVT